MAEDDVLSKQFYEKNPWITEVRPVPEDYGREDWEFPKLDDVTPDEAAKIWDAIERQAKAANKRAAILKARKQAAKEFALRAIEASPYKSVRVEGAEGRDVQFTPYDWEVFQIVNENEFKAWADKEAERYYDDSPRLRESIFLDEMRRRSQDRQPLPPGVTRWMDTRISRTTVPQRRRRAAGGPGPDQGRD